MYKYVLNVEDRLSHRIKCICTSFHHVSTSNLQTWTSSSSTDSYRFPIPLQMELAVDNFARLRLSVFPRICLSLPHVIRASINYGQITSRKTMQRLRRARTTPSSPWAWVVQGSSPCQDHILTVMNDCHHHENWSLQVASIGH